MAALLKVLRRALASTCLQSASVPRCMSNCPIRLIEGTREIEEETLSTYKHRNFCPAHVGEVLNSQYQIVTKSLDTGSTRRYGSAETCSNPSTAHARCSRHRRGVGRPPHNPLRLWRGARCQPRARRRRSAGSIPRARGDPACGAA